jgi:hypothetical protein
MDDREDAGSKGRLMPDRYSTQHEVTEIALGVVTEAPAVGDSSSGSYLAMQQFRLAVA